MTEYTKDPGMSRSLMEDWVTPSAPQEDLYHEYLEKQNGSDEVEK